MSKAIIKGSFELSKIKGEVDAVLKDTAKKEAQSFRRTVSTWSSYTKPKFKVTKIPDGYAVTTDSMIYAFVNYGTKRHRIAARGKGNGGIDPYTGRIIKGADFISYQSEFTPKTSPNRIGAKEGGKSGEYTKPRKAVMHSGITPRLWTEKVIEKQPKRLADSIVKVIEKNAIKR